MAIYTVTDKDYGVVVCKNLDILCDEVIGRKIAGQNLFIGRKHDGMKASIKNIKTYLRNSGNCVMWIYCEGESDWVAKVQRHK